MRNVKWKERGNAVRLTLAVFYLVQGCHSLFGPKNQFDSAKEFRSLLCQTIIIFVNYQRMVKLKDKKFVIPRVK